MKFIFSLLCSLLLIACMGFSNNVGSPDNDVGQVLVPGTDYQFIYTANAAITPEKCYSAVIFCEAEIFRIRSYRPENYNLNTKNLPEIDPISCSYRPPLRC